PEATAFHHPAWGRVLADTYGYPSVVLAEPGLGAGVVLAQVPRLRGRAWISLPFSDHCPPLARDAAALDRLADGLAGGGGDERGPTGGRGRPPAARAWSDAAIGVRHVLTLGGDPEVLRTGLSATHRRRLRQGERSGLEVRFGTSADDVADFYRLQVA